MIIQVYRAQNLYPGVNILQAAGALWAIVGRIRATKRIGNP